MAEIVKPTLKAMRTEGIPFSGILYAGLMITDKGPRLVEYNVRFGDPEAQVLMMRLKDDLLTLVLGALDQSLDTMSIRWHPQPALSVVMASRGYPGSYDKGTVIRGVEQAAAMDSVEVFHAGTVRDGDTLKANGGRVLNVTALGRDIREAQARAYAAIDLIDWPDGFCRRDIGWRAVERESET
jgi:phosphoribosylamine--glycine ligase